MAETVKQEAARQNVTESTILEMYRGYVTHRKALEAKQAEVNSVRGEMRSFAKEAKKVGVNMEVLSRLYDDSKRDLIDVQKEERDRARYARYLRLEIGAQTEMPLDEPEPAAGDYEARKQHERFMAEQSGENCGRNGTPRDNNPYVPGSEDAQAWDGAWLVGSAWLQEQDKIAGSMGPKPRRGRKGAAGGEMTAAP